jgi:hypothetical protein
MQVTGLRGLRSPTYIVCHAGHKNLADDLTRCLGHVQGSSPQMVLTMLVTSGDRREMLKS